MKAFLLTCLALSATASAVPAQRTKLATIVGIVADTNKTPMPDVEVIAIRAGITTIRSAAAAVSAPAPATSHRTVRFGRRANGRTTAASGAGWIPPRILASSGVSGARRRPSATTVSRQAAQPARCSSMCRRCGASAPSGSRGPPSGSSAPDGSLSTAASDASPDTLPAEMYAASSRGDGNPKES